MNKIERDKLARLTADLIYSFTSMPEAIGAGQRILREFPGIGSDVQEYRSIIAMTNISSAINNALFAEWNNGHNTREISALHQTTSNCLMDCVDNYMSAATGEVNNEELYALERDIGNSTNDDVWVTIGPLVHSPEWARAVGEYHVPGTTEFNYLTFNQAEDAI